VAIYRVWYRQRFGSLLHFHLLLNVVILPGTLFIALASMILLTTDVDPAII